MAEEHKSKAESSGKSNDGQTPPRITELANELTSEMDVVSPSEFVRLLRLCDAQVFSGWRHHPGLYDEDVSVNGVVALTKAVVRCKHVVFSGCGTSGRIAYWVCRTFNRVMAHLHPNEHDRKYHYLISGGDQALLVSEELPEDDPITGAQELQSLVNTLTKGDTKAEFVFVGITCGLSAPYVAGQLDWSMSQPQATTAMMGFNPVCLSRDAPVEGWDKTFRQVATTLKQRSRTNPAHNIIINPIVGPEPVTGSSRMKGGSVTKILLETALTIATNSTAVDNNHQDLDLHAKVKDMFYQYERTYRHTYLPVHTIGQAMNMCGEALRSGGHIYYLGGDSLGPMAFIDASEMPDTYGTPHTQVRAFVEGGWGTLENAGGDFSLESDNQLFCISTDTFRDTILPLVQANDTVVYVTVQDKDEDKEDGQETESDMLLQKSKAAGARTAKIIIDATTTTNTSKSDGHKAVGKPNNETLLLRVSIPSLHSVSAWSDHMLSSISAKWILNVLTTGANVQNGLVIHNKMINLTVANNKLFTRSANIIAEFAGVPFPTAETAMLKAIHQTDELDADIRAMKVSEHVIKATAAQRIIPQSVLIAKGKTVQQAAHLLQTQPNIRMALASLQKEQ